MNPPKMLERRFEKNYAQELLQIAAEDLKTAKFLFSGIETQEVRKENVFFLVQQAIEKALKAVLCHEELAVPLVHDLGILVARIPQHCNYALGYQVISLSEFAGVRRYEQGRVILTKEEAQDVIALGDETILWATGIISDTNPRN